VRIVRAFLVKEDRITKESGRFDRRRKLGKGTTAAVVTTGQRRSCCGTNVQSRFSVPQFVPENFAEDLVHRRRSL
jgi:hypothetical protein